MTKPKDKNPHSIPLRPMPKSSPWYYKLKSPYMSRREGKHMFKGFLILCTFLVFTILFVIWIGISLAN